MPPPCSSPGGVPLHPPGVADHARFVCALPPSPGRCGPCKMILPTLQQWAEELEGRCDIVKFNCNKANKELGVKVGRPTALLPWLQRHSDCDKHRDSSCRWWGSWSALGASRAAFGAASPLPALTLVV